jgi:hypothetical protein
VKIRSAGIVCALVLAGVALTSCSSNSSSSPSPSAPSSMSQSEFCNNAKKAQEKLQTLGQDLASGDAGKQNVAIQSLTTYFNQLLATLPANANAAISQALTDAKANVSKGASDPNYQQSISKLTEAVKKQCPNL